MTSSRTLSIVIALASAVLIGGCSSDPDPGPSTPQSTSESTSEPAPATESAEDDIATTTAAPTLSAQEQDEEAISTTLEDYTTALDEAKNGEASIEGIYPYATGTAREQWITQLMSYEAQGLTLSGNTGLEIVDIVLDDDNAKVLACVDLSGTDAVDEDGESILPADHLKRTLTEYVLLRSRDAETGWLVTEDVNRSEPCDD